jgi:hypothetical protein
MGKDDRRIHNLKANRYCMYEPVYIQSVKSNWLQTRRSQVEFPAEEGLFLLTTTSRPPPTLIINGTGSFSTRLKQRACQADHLSLSSSEVKNEWRFTSTLLTLFLGVMHMNSRNFVTVSDARQISQVRIGSISCSHGGEYEDDCLLGCCAV